MESLTLEAMDRDGAIAETLDGFTRAQVLRAAALGAVGGGAALAGLGADKALAYDRATDLTVLQFALVLERLGAAFYGEAVRRGKLSGETLRFAKTVREHEEDHAAFVAKTISALGGTPNPAPQFDFGNVTASPNRFQRASAKLEELCVEALNGAGPLVSKDVLAGAGMLVSVEARHVSWIRNIRKAEKAAQGAFDPAISAQKAQTRVKRTGFIVSGL